MEHIKEIVNLSFDLAVFVLGVTLGMGAMLKLYTIMQAYLTMLQNSPV